MNTNIRSFYKFLWRRQVYLMCFLFAIPQAFASSYHYSDKVFASDNIQQIVRGQVISAQDSLPLPGVTVLVKGTNNGVITDFDGNFEISVSDPNPVLEVSYLGFITREVPLNGETTLNIVLEEDLAQLDEVVVVGYGTQSKRKVTAAISSIDGSEVTAAPVANISNSLSGRIPGIISTQPSGEPGNDADQISIRGIGTLGNSSPLVIVDGIQRSLNNLDPNSIETITVLKDAAAVAPYGLGGANGVILVTTKRGKEGKLSLNYNGWYGIQQPTNYPNYLDAVGYARLLNTANENEGNAPTYTEEDLQQFAQDTDRYPNTDWVEEVLNFEAPITSHNLTFMGGSEKIRFFSSLGYLFQEGVVPTINYKRYNLASNIDADVSKTTTISLDVKGILGKKEAPGGISGTGIFTNVTKNPPILPYRFSNGLAGTSTFPEIYESGYDNTTDNNFYSQFTINQEIPIVPGLALKGVLAYDKGYTYNKRWTLPVTYYGLNAEDEFEEQEAGPPAPTLSEGFEQGENITIQGYVTYDRSFGNHDIRLLGVFENRSGKGNNFSASRIGYVVELDELSLGSSDKNNMDNAGHSYETAQIGWVYRAGYSYNDKYLVEFSGRYDGHYYFAPGKRFEFFPAVSLGWQLAEENFIRDHFDWIKNLKIRGSYGKSGNLAGNPFQYLTSYGLRNGYVFGGPSPYQVQGIYELREANPEITWETANKFNIGLEGMFWNGQLNFEMDFFHEERSNMLLSPSATIPVEYGIGLAQENAGIMENRGVDFTVGTHQKIGDFLLDAGFNFSYAKNKLIETFENSSTYENPNRRRTGRPLGTMFGYRALGLFQTDEEAAEGATQFGEVQAGDIKYDDVNGDGVINSEDEVVIGKSSFPEVIYGFNSSLSWKGFDMNMLWQGAAGVSFYLKDDAAYAFFNGAKVQDFHLDHWIPENTDASYPRITPSPTTNTTQQSSYWIKDASYLRLKTLEVGYSLPSPALDVLHLEGLRVFFSGQNLLTFSEIKNFDPGVSDTKGRYYFQQKTYSVGLNLNF